MLTAGNLIGLTRLTRKIQDTSTGQSTDLRDAGHYTVTCIHHSGQWVALA